jgi:pimeloyl-ACP methyl ester carboxylesterase
VINVLDKVPGFNGPFLRLLLRDVYDYVHDVGGLRTRTMDRVIAPIIANQNAPIVLVAHSLGSIVSYDILNTHPALKVDLLVTIGSPLGIDNTVRRRLLSDKAGKRGVPAGVRAWLNAADVDDVVALDETLADDFGRGRPSVITDVIVKNPKSSPHSGSAYISQKKVCQRMAQVL